MPAGKQQQQLKTPTKKKTGGKTGPDGNHHERLFSRGLQDEPSLYPGGLLSAAAEAAAGAEEGRGSPAAATPPRDGAGRVPTTPRTCSPFQPRNLLGTGKVFPM